MREEGDQENEGRGKQRDPSVDHGCDDSNLPLLRTERDSERDDDDDDDDDGGDAANPLLSAFAMPCSHFASCCTFVVLCSSCAGCCA